jgi:hypothetical protein
VRHSRASPRTPSAKETLFLKIAYSLVRHGLVRWVMLAVNNRERKCKKTRGAPMRGGHAFLKQLWLLVFIIYQFSTCMRICVHTSMVRNVKTSGYIDRPVDWLHYAHKTRAYTEFLIKLWRFGKWECVAENCVIVIGFGHSAKIELLRDMLMKCNHRN